MQKLNSATLVPELKIYSQSFPQIKLLIFLIVSICHLNKFVN